MTRCERPKALGTREEQLRRIREHSERRFRLLPDIRHVGFDAPSTRHVASAWDE
jgi:hypothetical protein